MSDKLSNDIYPPTHELHTFKVVRLFLCSAVLLESTLLIFIKSVLAMARELRAFTSSLVSLMRGRCCKPVSTT